MDEAVGYQQLFPVGIQPHALWCVQNDVYGDTNRRPYVMTGVYPQSVRPGRGDTSRQIITKLAAARRT